MKQKINMKLRKGDGIILAGCKPGSIAYLNYDKSEVLIKLNDEFCILLTKQKQLR